MANNKVVVAPQIRKKITWLGKSGQVIQEQTIEPGEKAKRIVPLQFRKRL